MTALIKFFPILGSGPDEPQSYLLTIDDFSFLLDAGWSPSFNEDELLPLKNLIQEKNQRIDAILISHCDINHMGALPYVHQKLGLKSVPIYATLPVHKMGEQMFYDTFQSHHNCENFDSKFTLDDIDNCFETITQMKYFQNYAFEGERGKGIQIIPLPAGHLIGGAIWKIKKETEEIIYAVDYNHTSELHLNKGALYEAVKRPSLLITDALNGLTMTRRQKTESEFLQSVISTVRQKGKVLLPIDSAGRVLEILAMLDQAWTNQKLSYPIVFLSYMSGYTIEAAKSQLEWMSDEVINANIRNRENIFSFKNIKVVQDLDSALSYTKKPLVLLSTLPDMEAGFAKMLVGRFASASDSKIIFTTKPAKGSPADRLLNTPIHQKIRFEFKEKYELQGEELEEYQKQQIEKEQVPEVEMKNESEEEDSDDELIVKAQPFQKVMDMTYDQFIEQGFRHPYFPHIERKALVDEYGESLTKADFQFEDDEEKNEEEAPVEAEAAPAIPTKVVSVFRDCTIGAQVLYFDLEGRSDGRAMKTIIRTVAPRQLILTHGSNESKETLKNYFLKNLRGCENIYVPQNQEAVHVTSDTNIYRVILHDNFVRNLDWKTFGEYKLAWFHGQFKVDPQVWKLEAASKPETTDTTPDEDLQKRKKILKANPPLLQDPPFEDPGHPQQLVGELKLSIFKQVLANAGFKSEFVGEAELVTCDGNIVIKRHPLKGLLMEGVLCKEYWKIRDLLYQQFTLI